MCGLRWPYTSRPSPGPGLTASYKVVLVVLDKLDNSGTLSDGLLEVCEVCGGLVQVKPDRDGIELKKEQMQHRSRCKAHIKVCKLDRKKVAFKRNDIITSSHSKCFQIT
jgi:hypothetical protein